MRDFFKYTCATVLGLVLFSILSVVGLSALLIGLIISATTAEKADPVEKKSVLVYDLSLTVNDSQPELSTAAALNEALNEGEGNRLTLRSLLHWLKEASTDDRIVALYIKGGIEDSFTGLATLKEIRAALEQFRAAGKPIYAYDTDWSEREYYLASTANTLAMNPIGAIELNGFSSENVFFAGALKKYGIGVQVIRVGKYKAAVEPFILSQNSPEARQQTQQLMGDLWKDYLGSIGGNRQMQTAQLQTLANSGGVITAEEAKQKKLVDQLAFQDEINTTLHQLTGEDPKEASFRHVDLLTYGTSPAHTKSTQTSKQKIAVVYAEGEIISGEDLGGQATIGGDRLARQLREIRADEAVKAVVLRVNSPGGSATATEVIGREVELTQAAKPLIVSMGDYAASGGYWIAAPATAIFAEPTTITGSIGVFGVQMNIQQLANNQGVTFDVVKTAPFADLGTISRPLTPPELLIQQRLVDQTYDRFVTHVAETRKLPKAKVQALAQGRVWSGAAAKQLGLVDEIGGIEAAIAQAAQRANLGDDWQVEEYPKPRTWQEQLFESFSGDPSPAHTSIAPDLTHPSVTDTLPLPPSLHAEFQRLQSELAVLKTLSDPKGIYTRLPYQIQVK